MNETIAEFTGHDLMPSAVKSIAEQFTFEAMKSNPAVNMSCRTKALYHIAMLFSCTKGKYVTG